MKKLQQYGIRILSFNEVEGYRTSDEKGLPVVSCRATEEGAVYTKMSSSDLLDRAYDRMVANPDSYSDEQIDNRVITDFIVFSFKGIKADNEEGVAVVNDVMENGVTINGKLYQRVLRSSAQKTAGAATLTCLDRDEVRETVSLGLLGDESKNAKFKTSIDKFEARLGLALTSSHKIDRLRPYMVIVDDIERQVTSKIKTAEVQANGERKVVEGIRTVDFNTNDGCGIMSPEWHAKLVHALQMSKKESKHGQVMQVRMPFVKGILAKFDMVAFCIEHSIEVITDCYGVDHKISDIDVLMPTSMFKGAGFYNNIQEYYSALDIYYSDSCFRVSAVSKKKPNYAALNYQFLQCLNLTTEDILNLSDTFLKEMYQAVFGSVSAAKHFLGLTTSEIEETDTLAASRSLLSQVLTTSSGMHVDPYIKSSILKFVRESVMKLKQGSIPVEGAFQYILGDVSLLLLGQDRANEAILQSGGVYSPGKVGHYLGARSPMVHYSGTRKLNYVQNENYVKWFGHLSDITVMNSYELTAMAMDGADFDGDKIFVSNLPMLVNAVIETDYLIISNNEGASSPKLPLTWENINVSDRHALGSQIGLITNTASYWISKVHANGGYANISKQDDDRIALMRMSQGDEIDSSKTGVSVVLEQWLATKKFPTWLIGASSKAAEYIDCPMQHLSDYVTEWYKAMQAELKDYGKRTDVNTIAYMLGKPVGDSFVDFTDEFISVKNQVAVLEEDYRKELADCARYCEEHGDLIDESIREELVVSILDDYKLKCSKVTDDRKMLAKACSYVTYMEGSKSQNKGYSFPWIVALDGILMNLNEYSTEESIIIPLRHVEVSGDLSGYVCHVEGEDVYLDINEGIYKFPFDNKVIGEENGVKVYDVSSGEYSLLSYVGKHYISTTTHMSAEMKDVYYNDFIDARINADINKRGSHEVIVSKNLDYDLVIGGFTNEDLIKQGIITEGFDAGNIYNLISSTNRVKFEVVTIKNLPQLAVFNTDGVCIGVVTMYGKYGIEQGINLYSFTGKYFDVKSMGDIFNKKGSLRKSVDITVELTAFANKSYNVTERLAKCNLKAWYFKCEWNKVSDFQGINNFGVDVLNNKPKELEFATIIHFDTNGVGFDLYTGMYNGELIVAKALVNGEEVNNFNMANSFIATVLRASEFEMNN